MVTSYDQTAKQLLHIQSDHRDKNIPGLARVPYDLRFSLVLISFPWFSWAFEGPCLLQARPDGGSLAVTLPP